MYYAVVPYKSMTFDISDKILVMDMSDFTCEYITRADMHIVSINNISLVDCKLMYNELNQDIAFFFNNTVIRRGQSGILMFNEVTNNKIGRNARISYMFKYRNNLVIRLYYAQKMSILGSYGTRINIVMWQSVLLSSEGKVLEVWDTLDSKMSGSAVAIDTLLNI